jgi:hypothetical protein
LKGLLAFGAAFSKWRLHFEQRYISTGRLCDCLADNLTFLLPQTGHTRGGCSVSAIMV